MFCAVSDHTLAGRMLLGLLWSTICTILASFFLGFKIRMDPSLSPNETAYENYLDVIFSHQIAHRGGSQDAPENTMPAFVKAVEHGVKTIEIDIQFTADGVPVG